MSGIPGKTFIRRNQLHPLFFVPNSLRMQVMKGIINRGILYQNFIVNCMVHFTRDMCAFAVDQMYLDSLC